MVALGVGAVSYERGTPVIYQAWKGEFKPPWRKAGQPNYPVGVVDSDQ